MEDYVVDRTYLINLLERAKDVIIRHDSKENVLINNIKLVIEKIEKSDDKEEIYWNSILLENYLSQARIFDEANGRSR